MTCPYRLDPTGSDLQGEAALLRSRGPAVQIELPGGVVAWSVNTYAAARQVFADPRFAKDPRNHWPAYISGEIKDDWPLISWVRMDSMAIADGEHHRHLRGLVAGSFTARRVEALRPLIERTVTQLLDGMTGATADLRRDFAFQLPALIICEIFGVPQEARAEVLKGGQVAVDTTLTPEEAEANLRNWQASLHELAMSKRHSPGDDMTTRLVQAGLNDSELVGSLFMLLGAGSVTVTNLITKAVLLLLTHPGQLELVRSGQAGWDDVVEETLRLEPAIVHLPLRYATEDVEIGEAAIGKGEPVSICLAAANRDPAQHGATADEFDLTRAGKEHLAFGHGVHHCLGAALARLQCGIALSALFQRFPQLRLALLPEQLQPEETFIMNGNVSLPVELGADMAVLEVPERIIAAWARNDADAFAEVFTEDATLILPGDVYLTGREEIRAFMAKGYAGPYQGTRVMGTPLAFKRLGERAILMLTKGGVLAPGEETVTPEREIRASWIMSKQDDRWLITAYQNTPLKAS